MQKSGNAESARRVNRAEGFAQIKGLKICSAIGISAPRGSKFAPSVFADYRHDHLVFERQQSQALRGMEWEGRVKPLLPWSTLILRGLGAVTLASVVLAILI